MKQAMLNRVAEPLTGMITEMTRNELSLVLTEKRKRSRMNNDGIEKQIKNTGVPIKKNYNLSLNDLVFWGYISGVITKQDFIKASVIRESGEWVRRREFINDWERNH